MSAELPPTAAATRAVRACAHAALLLEQDLPAAWEWPAELKDEDFVCAARRQRVAPMIVEQAGRLTLPAAVTHMLLAHRDAERLAALQQVHELTGMAAVLRAADIEFLCFKGPALSLISTGRFDARGAGDLDVLVEPMRLAAARAALTMAGWQCDPDFPLPGRTWGWRWQLRTHYELPLRCTTSTIDLHWRLDPTRRALPDFAEAWSRRRRIEIAGAHLDTLGRAHTFSHACSHAAKDDWRWLRSLVDIHRLARDQSLWREVRLRRVDLMSLAATDAAVGLPDAVPAHVRRLLADFDWVRRRAAGAQERPVPSRDDVHAPGARTPDMIRRSLRGSWAPSDVALVLGSAALPPSATAAVPDRHAVTAVPRALAHRARRFGAVYRRWRSDD